MTGNFFRPAVALLLIVLGTTTAAPVGAQNQNGSAALAHPGKTRGPRPGPNFPALESYYPEEARHAGQEGAAVIHFCVDPNGRLTSPPIILTSSGNEALDTAALNLANAGSGLYVPGYVNGVVEVTCGEFRIKFELSDDPVLKVLENPRVPIISARLRALSIEYGRRMAEVEKVIDMPRPVMLVPEDPATARTIRQYARGLDAVLDQSAGIVVDMLDDMEYLGRSRDIPDQERIIFLAAWPDERAALVRNFLQMVGAARDIVRSMDEMADYVSFSTPRRGPDGIPGASLTPLQDPQLEEIRERVLKAIRRLQIWVGALSKASPPAGDVGR